MKCSVRKPAVVVLFWGFFFFFWWEGVVPITFPSVSPDYAKLKKPIVSSFIQQTPRALIKCGHWPCLEWTNA